MTAKHTLMLRLCLIASFSVIFAGSCSHAGRFPFQNPDLDTEIRVEDLVSRMTLEEKVSQMTNAADAIEHLGIPEYNWWNECLHGVARAGKATVFPQAIGMAATFDRELMYRMADVTSTEARAKHHDFMARGKRGIYQGLTFWSPNINIFRDPRWGRGHETYGEDPYLTGEMALQFIRGLQGDHPRYLKVVATAKHYAVHSGPEPARHSFNAVVSERDFRDTYLPAFRKSVQQGKVYSVMCAYNRYMGTPCCGSVPLQEELLREELGFEGYVVSDCGAIYDFYTGHGVVNTAEEAATMGVRAGTDLNCGDRYRTLTDAVRMGLISEEEIDLSVKRLMKARMKLGMFDPPEQIPWSQLSIDTVASETHRAVALQMARESIVLLRNENNALPLDGGIRNIAIIGPNADNADVQYGNYNGTPVDPVTVVEAIQARLGSGAEVRYALGSPHHEGLPYLVPVPADALFTDRALTSPGLSTFYMEGLGAGGSPVYNSTEAIVDKTWWDGDPPVDGLTDDNYRVEWSGFLVPRKDGTHALGVEGKFVTLILEGDTVIRHQNIHHPDKRFISRDLISGRPYRIKVIMEDRQGDAGCTLHWQEPDQPLLWEALQTARWADHVVLVMGLTARLEGEEMRGLELDGFHAGDRTSLELPAVQQQLIRSVAATGKPVTLVLMSGSALALGREQQWVPSILQAWYGGEAAGTAVAEVLFGDYNPAGRLPVTFYRSVEDLPPFDAYEMEGRTYRYYEGEVLYPFGYGLSYTWFKYDNFLMEKEEAVEGEQIMVSVDVTNTGDRDGDEVVQLYVRYPESGTRRPTKELKEFRRVRIRKGQTIAVTLTLDTGELATYDESAGSYRLEPGTYQILVGPSSEDEKLLIRELTVR